MTAWKVALERIMKRVSCPAPHLGWKDCNAMWEESYGGREMPRAEIEKRKCSHCIAREALTAPVS